MSLIDTTFFVANLNITNTDDATIAETLTWFINKYEQMFLEKLFGYPLYVKYKANPTDQRFKDIIDGKEYTDINGYLNKWNGLVETIKEAIPSSGNSPAISAQKQSIITNYVYYWYLRNAATQTAGIGEVRPQGENVTTVSPRQKMISAWNEMGDKIKQLMQFLDANQATYPEWTSIDKNATLKYFGFINPFF